MDNIFFQSTFNIHSPERDDRMTDRKMAPPKNSEERTDKNVSISIFELPEERLLEIGDNDKNDNQ